MDNIERKYEFKPGEIIRSHKVNQEFDNIIDKINHIINYMEINSER